MKFKAFALFFITAITSCDKSVPLARQKAAPTNFPTLAAAQLTLAKTSLSSEHPQEAISYLQASLESDPTEETAALLKKTLAETRFSIPTLRLDHPYKILQLRQSGDSLFAALGGPHPTLIRWDLTDTPIVAAILFPADAKAISQLLLSPSGKYLIVQRDATKLLCLAKTLKPITALEISPEDLDPESLQPFSGNSLLVAHPVISSNHTLTWHIRDTATGDILRSETLPFYPKPIAAHFDQTTLHISLEDHTEIAIPIMGEILRDRIKDHLFSAPPILGHSFTSEGKTITRHLSFTLPSSISPSLELTQALTGYQLDPATQILEKIPAPNRLQILSSFFPEIPSTLKIFSAQTALESRLAQAYPGEFPDLSAPMRAHGEIIRSTFSSRDPAAISAVISALPPKGLPTATALLLAYQSGNRELVSQTLAKAENLPEALRNLGLPNRQIPDLKFLRLTQDWLGYESPDFSPLFRSIKKDKSVLAQNLVLPANPTEVDTRALLQLLLAPETLNVLGPQALSEAALAAAKTLSKIQAQATSALQLTQLAQRLGAPRAKILRIQATAQTSLADFSSAHRTWLDLITNEPVTAHLSSDYSEAAYTAFENANSRQAVEILETGIYRFPDDVAFAIRAGWIALLTDHPEEGEKYLTHAVNLGLPPQEIENTTALLAIAHTQLGNSDTAAAYLEQLKAIDAKWSDPASIEKLSWPEPLKFSLLQLYPLDLSLPE